MMLNKAVACALLLSATMGAAQAAERTWTFTWTGFNSVTSNWAGSQPAVFEPSRKYITEFTGSDANGNGTLEFSELSKLSTDSGNGPWNVLRCVVDNDCEVSFSFGSDQALDFKFDAGWYRDYDYNETWSYNGEEFGHRYVSSGSLQSQQQYFWTAATTLDIVASPVPEPSAWAMLCVGAVVLAGTSARRRRKAA